MKSLVLVLVLFLSCSAAYAANPCIEAAKEAVSEKYDMIPELDTYAKQPKGSGTYKLVVLDGACYYDVSVKMKKLSDDRCEAAEEPVLDEDSANCG